MRSKQARAKLIQMKENTILGSFGRAILLLLLAAGVLFTPLPTTHADSASEPPPVIVEALPYRHDEQDYAGVFETGNWDAVLDAAELSQLAGPVIFRTAIAINYDALSNFGISEDDLPSFPAWGGLLYQFKINLSQYIVMLKIELAEIDFDMRSKRETGLFETEREGDYLLVTALIPGDYASQHGGEFALYLNNEKVLAIAPRSMGMDELLIVHPAGANLYQMPAPLLEEAVTPAGDAPLLSNEYCQGGELIRTFYQDLNGDGRYHGPDDGELLSYEMIGNGTDLCPAGSSNAGGESSSNQPGAESTAPGDGDDDYTPGGPGDPVTRNPDECTVGPHNPAGCPGDQ